MYTTRYMVFKFTSLFIIINQYAYDVLIILYLIVEKSTRIVILPKITGMPKVTLKIENLRLKWNFNFFLKRSLLWQIISLEHNFSNRERQFRYLGRGREVARRKISLHTICPWIMKKFPHAKRENVFLLRKL